jgi:hypothetical protein
MCSSNIAKKVHAFQINPALQTFNISKEEKEDQQDGSKRGELKV